MTMVSYRRVVIVKPLEHVERWRVDTPHGSLFFPSLASAKRYVKRKSWLTPNGRAWPCVHVKREKVG